MSIVTKLPNVSAQSRAFISGRSKRTWHGDLYTQTGAGGNDREKAWAGRHRRFPPPPSVYISHHAMYFLIYH